MNTVSGNITDNPKRTDFSEWFDALISTLRSYELQMETNTANAEIKKMFKTLISGDEDELYLQNKKLTQMHFVKKILLEYLENLGHKRPQKLAFDLDDNEVLVWAQIPESNEEEEDRLLLAEAKVNAKYHNKGYNLTTTIVEDSDKLVVPNHYITY